EVSAEELGDYIDAEPTPPTPPRPTRPAPARPMPAADDERKVVTPQIAADRARLQAEPTPETPITYTVEESPTATNVDGLLKLALAKQIHDLKLELGISPKQYQGIVNTCSSNDELLAKLQELADAKADGFPLDRPAKKAQ
ncbi:MAG TPA: hypothetical protein VFN11_17175, partial [Ktedonobacterales bacterium]|nr:hypothetical protein [Ktedonobacterales bacterium]